MVPIMARARPMVFSDVLIGIQEYLRKIQRALLKNELRIRCLGCGIGVLRNARPEKPDKSHQKSGKEKNHCSAHLVLLLD